MARVLVLSSLSLTGISAIPSLSCVQWSDDGQLLLQTRNALYIMSPEMGISLGTLTSAIRQTPDARNGQGGSRLFRWRKTVISQRGGCTHQWPVDCQDFAAVSLGSIDPVLRRVAASPSNVTADAGCLLAVLNSNMELAIWGPVKNRLIGEWTQLLDITAEMRARYAENDKLSLVHVLQVQSTCIEWSSQADFGLSPAPQIDGSLLAVGNRAGSVSFIRLSVNVDGTYESRPVANITLSDRWLTHVAWSSWRLSESLKCEAFVACGVGDGSIVLVKVVQDVRPIPAAAGFFPIYELQATFEVLDIRPSDSNGRGITGMHWVDVGSNPDSFISIRMLTPMKSGRVAEQSRSIPRAWPSVPPHCALLLESPMSPATISSLFLSLKDHSTSFTPCRLNLPMSLHQAKPHVRVRRCPAHVVSHVQK